MSEPQIPFLLQLRDEVRRVATAQTRAPRARRLRRSIARLPYQPGEMFAALLVAARTRVAAGRWSLGAVAVVIASVLAVIVFAPRSESVTTAQAFPVLRGPSVITPAELQRALRIYGVSPGSDSLNIHDARAITTPWGPGYVLTNKSLTFICALAPGSGSADWAASCAPTDYAEHAGTGGVEFDYNRATGSARYLALLPAGATATAQTQGGNRRSVAIRNGALAFVVRSPTLLTTRIGGRVRTRTLVPGHANATPGPASSSATSERSTTAAR